MSGVQQNVVFPIEHSLEAPENTSFGDEFPRSSLELTRCSAAFCPITEEE